jgi:hypothetical protein
MVAHILRSMLVGAYRHHSTDFEGRTLANNRAYPLRLDRLSTNLPSSYL